MWRVLGRHILEELGITASLLDSLRLSIGLVLLLVAFFSPLYQQGTLRQLAR
jgi:hypothetical protein